MKAATAPDIPHQKSPQLQPFRAITSSTSFAIVIMIPVAKRGFQKSPGRVRKKLQKKWS